jgi:hypothetical protein
MLSEIRAGMTALADGTVSPARASRVGSQIIGDGQGRYYEATSRGTVFSAGITAWTSTVNAGNIINAAAGATSQFAVWNPAGSGKNLSLLKFAVYPISGTAPIPAVFHSAMAVAPTIATSVAATYGWFCCNNVGMATASVARVLASQAGAALTGSSAFTIIRVADLFITAGTAANLAGQKCVEYIDGDIVIPPGTGWAPTWAAAGTSFLGGYSVTWEEIPV